MLDEMIFERIFRLQRVHNPLYGLTDLRVQTLYPPQHVARSIIRPNDRLSTSF